MNSLTEFLKISTIHGLYHIGSNKVLEKLFWVVVVAMGFIGSSVMIYEAWDGWAQSPVRTTIETLPISGLEFPSVTVCPPRKSLTNLNLDIVRTKNISLSQSQRKDLSGQLSEVFLVSNMESKWRAYTGSLEKDRYRHQYHGISKIQLPKVSGSGAYIGLKYIGYRYILSRP